MIKTLESLNITYHVVKSQDELIKIIQEYIEETNPQFDYTKLPKCQPEDYHWDVLCKEMNNER